MKSIETERLLLRDWRDEDIDSFIAINQDPRVMEHFPALLTPEETHAFVDRIKLHFAQNGFGLWAVEVKETGEFIGFVGLARPTFQAHFTPCVEIGWRLAADQWGKGYATEAARAVLQVGFDIFNLPEIVSFTVPANVRSQRVMQKIGMQRNPADDLFHPRLPQDHPLSLHVLYRIKKSS